MQAVYYVSLCPNCTTEPGISSTDVVTEVRINELRIITYLLMYHVSIEIYFM